MPGRGGTRGGAGGGGAGGSLKAAEISASNSASTHCWSAYTTSANAAPASRVLTVMPITPPGTCGSVARSMTDTLFI
jgi:hypothetical protein